MHGRFFGWGDPEDVFVADGDLAGNVLAVKRFVGREPFGGVLVGFLLVGGAIDGEEVQWILAESFALGFFEFFGAGLPGIGQGDDVVDLDARGGAGAADEADDFASVGIVQGAGHDEAAVEDGVYEVAL